MRTKSATSGVLNIVGDCIAQIFESSKWHLVLSIEFISLSNFFFFVIYRTQRRDIHMEPAEDVAIRIDGCDILGTVHAF